MATTIETLIIAGNETTQPLKIKRYDDGCLMLMQGEDMVHLTVAQLRTALALVTANSSE